MEILCARAYTYIHTQRDENSRATHVPSYPLPPPRVSSPKGKQDESAIRSFATLCSRPANLACLRSKENSNQQGSLCIGMYSRIANVFQRAQSLFQRYEKLITFGDFLPEEYQKFIFLRFFLLIFRYVCILKSLVIIQGEETDSNFIPQDIFFWDTGHSFIRKN